MPPAWNFTSDGHLVSLGHDAGGVALDWTSRVGADGGHSVYMHELSSSLPHQQWSFTGKTLSSSGGAGLCLDSMATAVVPDADAARKGALPVAVQMRPCTAIVKTQTPNVKTVAGSPLPIDV